MDKKAKKILFNTYWKNGCWITKKEERIISNEDLFELVSTIFNR